MGQRCCQQTSHAAEHNPGQPARTKQPHLKFNEPQQPAKLSKKVSNASNKTAKLEKPPAMKQTTSYPYSDQSPQLSFACAAIERKLGQFIPKKQYERGEPSDPIPLDQQGSIYIGQLYEGFPLGLGKLYLPNKSYYSGTFREGVPDGEGRLITKDGIYYEGQVVKGQAWGQGKVVNHIKGYTFEGKWANDVPEGEGKETYTGVSEYQGQFKNGVKEGDGLYRRLGQYVYRGEFSNGVFKGLGKIQLMNGQCYEGEWKDGKFNGYGYYTWPDQTSYSGFFKDGLKHGEGKYTTKNKQVFEGIWQHGKRNGKGRLLKDGKEIEGMWANDKFIKRL